MASLQPLDLQPLARPISGKLFDFDIYYIFFFSMHDYMHECTLGPPRLSTSVICNVASTSTAARLNVANPSSISVDSLNESGPVQRRIEALEKQVMDLNSTVKEMHALLMNMAQETFRIVGSQYEVW